MPWVVDTSVLLDIRIGVPEEAAIRSAECLEVHAHQGLLISPVTFIEMAPAFGGAFEAQQNWLDDLGIAFRDAWCEEDTRVAHRLWHQHIERKRQGIVAKRPIADVLIAAFSHRFKGLITANEGDFKTIAPDLPLIVPSKSLD